MPRYALLTRRRYLRDEAALRDRYFAQFVTGQTLATVENSFGGDELSALIAADPELSSVPQKRWDAITLHQVDRTHFIPRLPHNRALITAAGDTLNRTTLTLIAKRAARMLAQQQFEQLA